VQERGSIRDVVILGDNTAGVPPRRWHPPAGAGMRIDHRSGESLDASWIRRQFELNGFGARGGSVAAAVALVQFLNRAFVTAGFVNSGLLVPPQTRLADGVLELRLIAGRLVPPVEGGEAISVAWAKGKAKGLDRDFVRNRFPAAEALPLNAFDVERDFRLLAENPAIRTVSADLRPGARPGEASLQLLIQPERRADITLGFANDRSPAVGGERFSAGAYFRNALTSGDLLTAEIGTTKGVQDAQIGYSAPFLSPRTLLTLRGSLNDAAVIDRPLIPLDIRAQDRSVEGGLVRRLIEAPLSPGVSAGRWTPSRTLSAGVLLAYRHQRSYLFGQPFSFAPGSENGRSRYAALRFTADYVQRGVEEVLALSATSSVGLGGTRSDTPAILNPDANFVMVLIQANYARRMGPRGLELRARLAGQLASSILYSGERLSIGGQNTVRGYRENLLLVDKGAIGSVELAWSFSLSGRAKRAGGFDPGAFRLAAFVDGAVGGSAEPPQPVRTFIAGAGAALTWAPSDALQLSIARAEALRPVATHGSPDMQDRSWHFRFTLSPLRLIERR
jgi:hemolysin activation/secretion protein